ncbi:O-antigen ligase domain-containing protein [Amycolatopsis tucumanensis]|uniref:Membrane protein n=1 Tax=Amycolatopsis tucumanensis TaxID=401106 RepID=A0ABP7I3S1_9PSEU|nr:O-antigen ligase domain-containing protein [Amycolatopsis tucumanensis]MCF6422965.1 O-antigen ligase domain-containing protein [Amycolatopsis tucumanensis]
MSLTGIRPWTLDEDDVARGPRTFRILGAIWALLIFNTLATQGVSALIPIPRPVTQALTMSAVGIAFALALILNPRLKIRPSAFLVLLSLLLVASFASSVRMESGLGSLFRCARLGLFVGTLWLISPWMNGSIWFVRQHIRVLTALLVSVAVGLVISPGLAMPELNDGRLTGVLWPLTPTQIGQYAAIAAGLAVLLWINKLTDTRSVVMVAGPAIVLLVLTHTRTATLGLVAGLVIAMLSMWLTSGRARKAFAWGIAVAGIGAVLLGPLLQTWVLRGQDAENFGNLTGRAKVWERLLATPRTWFEEIFGTGLSNKSFDGLPIDNSWLAIYHEQGYLGATIVVLFLVTLVVVAIARPPSPGRACALFLITYCLAASYTEAGLGDASPYLLHLAVAAGLLAGTPQRTVPR